MNSRAPYISKSKFLWGVQCPKLLWHAYNARHLIPEPAPEQQAIFDQGHEVGGMAKQSYPGGIEIGKGITDLDKVLALSKQALNQRRPLFEAAFAFNGGYARADILNPTGRDEWDVTEVKSTTEVKAVHLDDLAFRAHAYNRAGLRCHRSNQKQPLRVESKAATLRRVFHNGFRFLIKSSLGFAMLNRSAPAAS